MRRLGLLLASTLGMVILLGAPAHAAEGQMHVKVPGVGSYDLQGVSAWDPGVGTASWCSEDGCADSAALVLPASEGADQFPTGDGTVFAFTSSADNVSAASAAGECAITIYEHTSAALVGNVTCRDLPSSQGLLSLGARFRAEALSQPTGQVPGIAAPPEDGVASGAERIRGYDVEITIRPDGVLDVTERIDYDFGDYAVDRHGIYRDIPERFYYDEERDRVSPIEVSSVQATGGASADYEMTDLGDGQVRIKIGDADRTVDGRHTYTIRYTVEGALNAFADHDELYWNGIGTNWAVPIEYANVLVRAPEGGEIQRAACYAGGPGSGQGCSGGPEVIDNTVQFEQDALGPYEGLTVVVALDKGVVTEPQPILVERWTPKRAFSVTPATSGSAFAVLLLGIGGFAFLFWRKGRDRRFAGGAVAAAYGNAGDTEETVPFSSGGEMPLEFEPPDGIRPGQVGTLVDEVANPLDVTATIVDLAVRRYLIIDEIPKEGWLGKPDWKLTKLKDADTGLLTYERVLLNGLFEDGNEVLLSDLKAQFVARLKQVQESLYVDANNRKWFAGRPDKVRTKWGLIGAAVLVVSLVVAAILVVGTRFGLAGIALVITGLAFAIGAKFMPRRTGKGTAMVGRVMGFRRFIESPTQTGMAQLDESENVFSSYLPYAIVFGLTEKWAKAFESLAVQGATATGTYYWYRSTTPFAFADMGTAMNGFATTTAGTIASVPASSGSSGFSGGSSGGGFGGGGGGSW